MTLRLLGSCALLGSVVLLSRAAAHGPPAQPKPPVNIVFLFTDDQRWDTIHALGNPHIRTPTLDRLVNEGYTFTNAYCMGAMVPAVCLPSRTMVMTGRSLWRIPGPRQRAPELATIPSTFKQAGYVTFRSGKADNSYTYANSQFDLNLLEDDRDAGSSRRHADRAIEFLRSHDRRKPFYLHLAFPHPHDPRTAPPEYLAMYNRRTLALPKNFLPRHPFDNGELYIRDELLAPFPRTPDVMREHLADYYACITNLDAQIARILDALEEFGYADRTVIVFSSDQGLAVGGQHGLMGKQNLYESNKPPLVFFGPGIPRGRSEALVYLYDLFPTFCELAGIEIPATVEGQSLVPVMRGQKLKVRDYLFGAYRECQRMVRDDRWKLIKYHVGGVKYRQLFDLKTDPDELRNLADDPAAAEHLARLEQLLVEARRQFGDPVDFERNSAPASRPPRASRETPGQPSL